ncbi:MAG: hypothetical protein L0332_23530 [Chloroflexi bacterium]|nr:hypothetical protein [Chloroflexota bacterium]
MNAIALIACCKSKQPGCRPAHELYTGTLFRAQLAFAREGLGLAMNQIFILSARYGLIGAGQEIESYEASLAVMPGVARRVWLDRVWDSLRPRLIGRPVYVWLMAGKLYRAGLVERLRHHPNIHRVNLAPAGLGLGGQTAYWRAQLRCYHARLCPDCGAGLHEHESGLVYCPFCRLMDDVLIQPVQLAETVNRYD